MTLRAHHVVILQRSGPTALNTDRRLTQDREMNH